jgi:hypothetical protein
MKYYRLKYVKSLEDGFGGMQRFFNIKILEKYRNDVGLLEHEKFHVRMWYAFTLTFLTIATWMFLAGSSWWLIPLALSPYAKGIAYRNKYYRMWAEAQAYRIQLDKGMYSTPDFAVKALVNNYSLGITTSEAKKLLKLT